MDDIVAKLASDCSDLLKANPGPEGRAKVAALLSEVISNPENVDALIPPTAGERDVLYKDPELGFCILAHQYKAAKQSSPHDHGPSWAIYAQARGETEMVDYELLSPASEEVPGKVKEVRSYHLRPGDAHVYDEGDLHMPKRTGPTSLLRIEGTDMSKVKRLRYEAV